MIRSQSYVIRLSMHRKATYNMGGKSGNWPLLINLTGSGRWLHSISHRIRLKAIGKCSIYGPIWKKVWNAFFLNFCSSTITVMSMNILMDCRECRQAVKSANGNHMCASSRCIFLTPLQLHFFPSDFISVRPRLTTISSLPLSLAFKVQKVFSDFWNWPLLTRCSFL